MAKLATANTVLLLSDANDVADKTQAKMKDQTKRLNKMNEDLGEVNGNLDQTEAVITNMEKGFLRYMGESALGMVGIDMRARPPASNVDTTKPVIHQGWLQKRGPMYGYKFEPRWCCLYETGLLWFEDQEQKEKKGDTDIYKNSKVFAFSKNKAPGDAIKHRGEKPHGFVLDVNPKAGPGKERRLFYFDAEKPADQKAWIEAIELVARRLKQQAKGGDVDEGATGGDNINQAMDLLDQLDAKADALGAEAKLQANLVKSTTDKVEVTTQRIDAQIARTKQL